MTARTHRGSPLLLSASPLQRVVAYLVPIAHGCKALETRMVIKQQIACWGLILQPSDHEWPPRASRTPCPRSCGCVRSIPQAGGQEVAGAAGMAREREAERGGKERSVNVFIVISVYAMSAMSRRAAALGTGSRDPRRHASSTSTSRATGRNIEDSGKGEGGVGSHRCEPTSPSPSHCPLCCPVALDVLVSDAVSFDSCPGAPLRG